MSLGFGAALAFRVAPMSILKTTIAAVMLGQYRSGDAFREAYGFLVLLSFAVILLLVRLEYPLGPKGAYIVMLAGLFPVVLTIINNTGDNLGVTTVIVSGMAWSSAWLLSSLLGLRGE